MHVAHLKVGSVNFDVSEPGRNNVQNRDLLVDNLHLRLVAPLRLFVVASHFKVESVALCQELPRLLRDNLVVVHFRARLLDVAVNALWLRPVRVLSLPLAVQVDLLVCF